MDFPLRSADLTVEQCLELLMDISPSNIAMGNPNMKVYSWENDL
jgi:hypothetical protein